MSTPNMNKSLSEIFDIELTNTDKSIDELKIAAKVDSIDSLETQREYVKKNLVSLIEKGVDLLDNIIQVANSSELAKDYAAATVMIKTLVDTNMTLLESEVAHKPVAEISHEVVGLPTSTSTVFSGSTSDLARFIKESAMASSIEIVEIKKD